MKEMSDLFCSKAAVGGNYNLTRDIPDIPDVLTDMQVTTKSLFADVVRTKVMAEDVEVAAGLSS